MSNDKNCKVCSGVHIEGKKLTPRQIVGMTLQSTNVKAVVLQAFAESVIVHDNPPGGADLEMFWVCSLCLSVHFGQAEQSQSSKYQIKGNTHTQSSRKWWAFWKKRPTQDDYESSNSNNIENRLKKPKDYSNKVKKCLNCNAVLSSGRLRCPDCGSDHLFWQ